MFTLVLILLLKSSNSEESEVTTQSWPAVENFSSALHLKNNDMENLCTSRQTICRFETTSICGMRYFQNQVQYKDFENPCFLFLKNVCDTLEEDFCIIHRGTCNDYLKNLSKQKEIQRRGNEEASESESAYSDNSVEEHTKRNQETGANRKETEQNNEDYAENADQMNTNSQQSEEVIPKTLNQETKHKKTDAREIKHRVKMKQLNIKEKENYDTTVRNKRDKDIEFYMNDDLTTDLTGECVDNIDNNAKIDDVAKLIATVSLLRMSQSKALRCSCGRGTTKSRVTTKKNTRPPRTTKMIIKTEKTVAAKSTGNNTTSLTTTQKTRHNMLMLKLKLKTT